MATEILWKNIVGESTIENGGYAGDLLQLIMVHLEKANQAGQLTDSQVGEVYATSIGTSIGKAMEFELNEVSKEFENNILEKKLAIAESERIAAVAKATMAEAEKDIKIIEKDILSDIDSVNAKKTAIQKEGEIATSQVNISVTEESIKTEALAKVKEENGGLSYDYVYNKKYYDYRNQKFELAYDYINSEFTETKHFYIYVGPIGEWVETGDLVEKQYQVNTRCFSYFSSSRSEHVYTNIPIKQNNKVLGSSIVIKSKLGGYILVSKTANADGSSNVIIFGSYDASFSALLQINGVDRTQNEWSAIIADHIADPGNLMYADVEYMENADLVNSEYNPNNYDELMTGVLGADNNSDPAGKPNTLYTYSYAVVIDTSNIHTVTMTNAPGKSLVELNKFMLEEKAKMVIQQKETFAYEVKHKINSKLLDTYSIGFSANPTGITWPSKLNVDSMNKLVVEMGSELGLTI